MAFYVIIRGGGDLASGIALRLYRVGLKSIVTELPEPLVVRRKVSFAEAVFAGRTEVEGVPGRLARDLDQVEEFADAGCIPVIVDPHLQIIEEVKRRLPADILLVLVDARMTKQPPEIGMDAASLVIGLGPGFVVGENCHAIVETNRGHRMGRVYWNGEAEKDTGIPENVNVHGSERVLRAPADGVLVALTQIGDHLDKGQLIAEVAGIPLTAPFQGVLRGLLHPGIHVWRGLKLGDVDPRGDPRIPYLVSDKSLAVGGGVLEAILSKPELRSDLWD